MRSGHPEGVHQVRVAARRTRSVLATYRSVLPPGTDRLRAELGDLGRSLGPDRDAEVLEARLRELVDGQPPESVAPADDALPALVERLPHLLQADLDRLRKRVRAASRAQAPADRDLAWHAVRKAAKRLRYAAESTRPSLGARATELAHAAEAVQEALGEHQDSVMARLVLRHVATHARLGGEGDDS